MARKTKTILKRQRHQASWKQPEVDQLVLLLRRYGSDFATIAIQLNKERDQVKRKFKVLEKTHPHLAASIFEKSEVALHHDDYN